ncbi:hypothetical protein BDN72DRAFT_841811 [Pluteus cervinus]|uniref:Uncharacterized protein n=1 Tax=Pluteus cervinus TaxID=181527 RepID=A0ACD3ASY2_9AGAR|nr:hypothetical protein BDN72DRAFT_841811 [Pluteus cervinus]
MVYFLPELVEAVLGHIDKENELLEARHICSVVSRTWSSAARPPLFSEVHLNNKSLSPETDRGVISSRILAESPHTLKWINKLVLSASLDVPNSILADVARATTNLQSFNLSQETPTDSNLDRDFASALPNTLSSIRLTTISLFGIRNFPIQLFRHCIVLGHLTIKDCTFYSAKETPNILPATPKPHLRFLLVSTPAHQHSINILEWLLTPHCPFDLSQLQVLFVADRSGQLNAYDVVCQFVSMVSSTLKHLFLDPIAALDESSFSLFPAANLLNLQTLEVSITQREGGHDAQWAVYCLSHLPRPRMLACLVLHYGTTDNLYTSEFDQLATQVSSSPFDKLHIRILLHHDLPMRTVYMHVRILSLIFKSSPSKLRMTHVRSPRGLYTNHISLPQWPSSL